MTDLLLKRATASPGEVYDVMCEERIWVGLCCPLTHSSRGSGPSPTATTKTAHPHGYEPTREAAMQAFAKSWHRET